MQESSRVGCHHALPATALVLAGKYAEAEHVARQGCKLTPRYEAEKTWYVAASRSVYERLGNSP